MVRVDWPLSKPGIGSRAHSSPVPGTRLGQFVGQCLVNRIHKLLVLLSDILLRMAEDLGELGRWVIDARRDRKDGRPALGRRRLLPQPFVKLGNAD